MRTKVTVLIPTHNHGATLGFAVESVLRQSMQEFELLIVGDGISDEGRSISKDYCEKDERIKFFDNPKGPRHGERFRHKALQEARGEIVCYLADDDIWLSHHLQSMFVALADVDFAHVIPAYILPNGELGVFGGDIRMPEYRELMRKGRNFVPLSSGPRCTNVLCIASISLLDDCKVKSTIPAIPHILFSS
ncbi:MAG: glycosyltransferase family 2 protein [Planctomycetes bacterium]|nr:glycosyltransferase family 2 protein [Planctomycetota bacterium]